MGFGGGYGAVRVGGRLGCLALEGEFEGVGGRTFS